MLSLERFVSEIWCRERLGGEGKGARSAGGKTNQAPSKTTKGRFFNGQTAGTSEQVSFDSFQAGVGSRAPNSPSGRRFSHSEKCLLKTQKTHKTQKTQISGVPPKVVRMVFRKSGFLYPVISNISPLRKPCTALNFAVELCNHTAVLPSKWLKRRVINCSTTPVVQDLAERCFVFSNAR